MLIVVDQDYSHKIKVIYIIFIVLYVKTNNGIRLDYMRHFIDKDKDCWTWGLSNAGNCSYKVYYWLKIPSLKLIENDGKILKFLEDSYTPNHYFIQFQ